MKRKFVIYQDVVGAYPEIKQVNKIEFKCIKRTGVVRINQFEKGLPDKFIKPVCLFLVTELYRKRIRVH
jgi:hypothetical protein